MLINYLIIGVIVALVTCIVWGFTKATDEEKRLKVPQMLSWVGLFIVVTICWPLVILALLGLMLEG